MGFKNKLNRLLPRYTYIPLLSVIVINFLTYSATRLITRGFVHYDFSLPLDSGIPFVPAFIVIYVLAFVQWGVGFILIARDSREVCYKLLSGEIISKLICMAFFLIIPTAMVRPDITSGNFFGKATEFIYSMDTPDNLFPSVHCLESWFCFRGAMHLKKTDRWYTYFSLVFTLLVFASTVLVKQHVVVDIIAGVVVCEVGLFISKKTNSALVFKKIEAKLNRRKQVGGGAK